MSAYEVRRLDELEEIPVADAGIAWRPIRRTFGIRAFGINAYGAGAGAHVVEEHTEESLGHEEVYLVVSGRARFTLGDDELDVDAGSIVYVREPSTKRAAVALEDGTTVVAVGGKPGEAFTPSAWEWWFATTPHREGGDYEGALAIVADGLRDQPDSAYLNYAAARLEARLGRVDDALGHLGRAAELDEHIGTYAARQPDFELLRDDPRFLAIAGQPEPGGGGT